MQALTAIVALGFYLYMWRVHGKSKWEVVYVAFITVVVNIGRMVFPNSAPVVITSIESEERAPWIRYVGWLLTCPVLLIQLSNPSGEKVFNVARMMRMLVSVQLQLLCGITAAWAGDDPAGKTLKYFLWVAGVAFLVFGIFIPTNEIHLECMRSFGPRGARQTSLLIYLFYTTWCLYGLMFILAESGEEKLEQYEADIVYAILDIISKQVFGFICWYLRWEILKIGEKKDVEVEMNRNRPTRVVLYETDDIMGGFFSTKLQQMSVEVSNCISMEELLACLEKADKVHDFILANYNLLSANDFEVQYNLRRAAIILPVIAYARQRPSDISMEQMYMKGIDGFIEPPFSEDDLRAICTQWRRTYFQTVAPSRASFSLEREDGVQGFKLKEPGQQRPSTDLTNVAPSEDNPHVTGAGRPRRFSLPGGTSEDSEGRNISRQDQLQNQPSQVMSYQQPTQQPSMQRDAGEWYGTASHAGVPQYSQSQQRLNHGPQAPQQPPPPHAAVPSSQSAVLAELQRLQQRLDRIDSQQSHTPTPPTPPPPEQSSASQSVAQPQQPRQPSQQPVASQQGTQPQTWAQSDDTEYDNITFEELKRQLLNERQQRRNLQAQSIISRSQSQQDGSSTRM